MGSTQLGPGRWEHHFSASGLKDYLTCAEKGRRQYFRLLPDKQTEFTAMGRAVHKGIEKSFVDENPHDVAIEAFVEAAKHPNFQYVKYTPAECIDFISHHIINYTRFVKPHLPEPVAIEQWFDIPFYEDPFRTIYLRGAIDCVTERDIIDWKTAGSPHKIWEVDKYALQPAIYIWAWNQLSGQDRDHLRYVVFVNGKGIQDYSITRTPAHVEWVKFQAIQFARMVESGLPYWTMNDQGWYCAEKWCSAWHDCKGKILNGGM